MLQSRFLGFTKTSENSCPLNRGPNAALWRQKQVPLHTCPFAKPSH